MADKMRILELCLRESATAYQWGGKGNYLSCSKGELSFMLFVQAGANTIDYSLSYRYTEFDRIYHLLTSSNIYPGVTLKEGNFPVDSWSLMSVSLGMRTLTGMTDKFAEELSGKLTSPEENMKFLKYLKARAAKEKNEMNIDREIILNDLMLGRNYSALAYANERLLAGDKANGFFAAVVEYVRRHVPEE